MSTTTTTTTTSTGCDGTIKTETITVTSANTAATPTPAPSEPRPTDTSKYPATIGGLTTDYLSRIFGCKVSGFKTKPVDKPGFLADTFFVEIYYADGEDVADKPDKVCIKATAAVEQSAQTASSMDSYLKEVQAYRAFANDPSFPLRMPKAYATEGGQASCFLVLEDLRERGQIVDQLGDLSKEVNLAHLMLTDCAKLQGTYMDYADCSQVRFLREDWLATAGVSEFALPFVSVCAAFVNQPSGEPAWPLVNDIFANSPYGKKIFDTHEYPKATRVFDILASPENSKLISGPGGQQVGGINMELYKILHSRPVRTLNHGDARGDNAFLLEGGTDIAWLDWQLMHTGIPGFEVVHTLYQTFDNATSAEAEKSLESIYYETMAKLAEARVPDFRKIYTFDDCFVDYQIGAMLWAQAVTGYLCQFINENKANLPARVFEVSAEMISRVAALIERTDCLNIIEAAAARTKQ